MLAQSGANRGGRRRLAGGDLKFYVSSYLLCHERAPPYEKCGWIWTSSGRARRVQLAGRTVPSLPRAASARGVTGFLGSGNKPIPLSESDIAALGVEKREIVVGYEVGDSVKITDGALESFLGTVEEIDLDRSKVRVVVSMFGRETPVEL